MGKSMAHFHLSGDALILSSLQKSSQPWAESVCAWISQPNLICAPEKWHVATRDHSNFIGIHWHEIPCCSSAFSNNAEFHPVHGCWNSLCEGFFFHIGQGNISPFFSLFLFSFFEETLDPWKDMICILTTPGLDLGSRSLLSKNTCGSSVLLSVWILPPPAEGVWHKRTVYLLSGISFFFFFIPFLFLWVWMLMTHNCAKFMQFPPSCVQSCLPNLTIEINCS